MKSALRNRLRNDRQFRHALKDTKLAKIIFVDDHEQYWGFSMKSSEGKNKLGACLEDVRAWHFKTSTPSR
jgi:predicted NAD-dependent protein-ADP-ribosyltransferase YbiA (DUF1768 family)